MISFIFNNNKLPLFPKTRTSMYGMRQIVINQSLLLKIKHKKLKLSVRMSNPKNIYKDLHLHLKQFKIDYCIHLDYRIHSVQENI